MFDDISFVNLVLGSFYLRIFFISVGFLLSIYIVGIDKIFFLKKYIERSFFPIEKIIYWGIALLSLIYLKSVIEDNSLSLSNVFSEHSFVSLLLIVALVFILYDALIFMVGSIANAKEIKNDIANAGFFSGLSKIGTVASVASVFIPGGFFVHFAKFAVFGGARVLDGYINNKVKSTLTNKIKKTVSDMIKIVILNLFIVLGTLYVL
jgi:hypothetical protein